MKRVLLWVLSSIFSFLFVFKITKKLTFYDTSYNLFLDNLSHFLLMLEESRVPLYNTTSKVLYYMVFEKQEVPEFEIQKSNDAKTCNAVF